MARLIVEAFSEDTVAVARGRQPNFILVSVTDESGEPITGLGVENFNVGTLIAAPGGERVNISGVYERSLPGFYHINVVPEGEGRWEQGVYIFGIAVETGRMDKGQTLATVLLD